MEYHDLYLPNLSNKLVILSQMTLITLYYLMSIVRCYHYYVFWDYPIQLQNMFYLFQNHTD